MATLAPALLTPARTERALSVVPAEPLRESSPDGLVPRRRVVERLADPAGPPLAVIAAPAGYGKTSLLSEWQREERRPFALVSLTEAEDGPVALEAAVTGSFAGTDPGQPFALALDDVHVLRTAGARKALRELAGGIPPGSRLALASRTEPPLPTGRLRAHRALIEIRTRDLALTPGEATAVFRGEGIDLQAHEADALVERTEGWPAGVYLAAVSLHDQPDPSAATRSFRGDDVVMVDYLRDVVLA